MSEWFLQNGKYAQFTEIAYQEQKVIPAQVRLLLPKTPSKNKSHGNSTVLCLAVAEYQILGGKHFLILDQNQERFGG